MQDEKTVAIVSHDAGGAEILCNWVIRQSASCLFVLEGPAKVIFERKMGAISTTSLEDAISNSDWVLTGTSWPHDLERRAIKTAKQAGKKSVSFLDHWGYYLKRFKYGTSLVLPDEIWVGDNDALLISQKVISGVDILLKPNPYFEDVAQQCKSLNSMLSQNHGGEYILYVSSPLRKDAKLKYGDQNYWGFTEISAFRYFMDNISVLNHPTRQVLLRPHPSEEHSNYEWAIREYAPNVQIGGQEDLLIEIANSDIVAGFNSMAMVIGLIAEKRIINALPPGRMGNILPMSEIESMEDILLNSHEGSDTSKKRSSAYQYYDLTEDGRSLHYEMKLDHENEQSESTQDHSKRFVVK